MRHEYPFEHDEYNDPHDWWDIIMLVTVAAAIAIIIVEYVIWPKQKQTGSEVRLRGWRMNWIELRNTKLWLESTSIIVNVKQEMII